MQPCFPSPIHASEFHQGLELGRRIFQQDDAIDEVQRNPWKFVDSIFDLADPTFTETQRAGYIVAYLTLAFAAPVGETPRPVMSVARSYDA